jgi:hypothetical protein
MQTSDKALVALILGSLAVFIGFWGTVIYVAFHFISKFW